MSQRKYPAVFMRGGTSRAIVFHEKDLPEDQAARDVIFLKALGSPDPNGRQLDGLGGGISSLSKIAVVAPSARAEADVDFTFAQVGVTDETVDYVGTCGNISSAVGPFAVDEGLVEVDEGTATVRVYNTNTGKTYHARFPVEDGAAGVGGGVRASRRLGRGRAHHARIHGPRRRGHGKATALGQRGRHLRDRGNRQGRGRAWWTPPTRWSSCAPPTWA